MTLSKERAELGLKLAELVAEMYGKMLNEEALRVVALYQKGKSYNQREVEERVGRESVEKALSVRLIRKVNSNYELTDLGERTSEHFHGVLVNLLGAETPPLGMSEEKFRKYRELAEKYSSFLKE